MMNLAGWWMRSLCSSCPHWAGARWATRKRRIREFVDEYLYVDDRRAYLLGEGRLNNLAAAEGQAAEVMDMSFVNGVLLVEHMIHTGARFTPAVYAVPKEIDHESAVGLTTPAVVAGEQSLRRRSRGPSRVVYPLDRSRRPK